MVTMLTRLMLFLAAFLSPLVPAAAHRPPILSLEQNYTPTPAIWRLTDEDTTIYLFGTFHLLPEGFAWRSARFERIVDEVDTLVLESSEADAIASMAAYAPKIASLNEGRPRISQLLAPALRAKWRQMVEAEGRTFEVVDTMPLALAMLGLDGTGNQDGTSRPELGVESVLAAEFAATGRPVESIESHGAVMLSLMRIDDAPLLAELSADLQDWPGLLNRAAPFAPIPSGPDWSMEHAWAQGEIDPDFDLGVGNGKAGSAFQRILLARRNEAWSYWLQSRLARPGTILVAVGAGHFEGRRSVQYYLSQRGLTAERVE